MTRGLQQGLIIRLGKGPDISGTYHIDLESRRRGVTHPRRNKPPNATVRIRREAVTFKGSSEDSEKSYGMTYQTAQILLASIYSCKQSMATAYGLSPKGRNMNCYYFPRHLESPRIHHRSLPCWSPSLLLIKRFT